MTIYQHPLSLSTSRVLLKHAHIIVTNGYQFHTEVSACDEIPNLLDSSPMMILLSFQYHPQSNHRNS